MSKSNPLISNNILNEVKDDLESKGRDALRLVPGVSTPCLTKDILLTVHVGNIGSDDRIMFSPERNEVKREGMTGVSEVISTRAMKEDWEPRVWAILIGIDGYKTKPLSGCVSDARLMKKYLIEDIRVPEENIRCLLGPSEGDAHTTPADTSSLPTRANIINMLLSLVNNPEIKKDDYIIIYYAGHGASYPDPTGNTETLCPIDRNAEVLCHDISDREINVILHQISCSKGNRITVILDCCYSGGTTRAGFDPLAGQLRCVPPLANVSAQSTLRTADEDLHLSGSNHSVLAPDWSPIMDSHVILAACRDTERARELPGNGSEGCNGVFTVALLHALKSGLLTYRSTYMDLLNIVVVDGQKPVLAGKHKHSELGPLVNSGW